MASVQSSAASGNGLAIHRIALPGTRALTIMLAFDAGARSERSEENGIAHFLEHLVFKGGDRYPTHQAINRTAEQLGGVLNAFTSQDMVAFHITVRAEAAAAALDLLSDFVAQPRLDAEELERERGVVIQEINRAYDQPSVVAEYLIDRAAFGDHPLGRTVLGPAEHLQSFSREQVVAFRERRWGAQRAGLFLAGNIEHLPEPAALDALCSRLPALPAPEPFLTAPEPIEQVLVEQRDTNQSHLRMLYRPQLDLSDRAMRAAFSVYATLLGGSMSSRLFEEIREQRGLCYSVYAVDHAFADAAALQLGSGLQSDKCIEAYRRMREIVDELRADGPSAEEVERARAYTAGRLVLAFENTGAVARFSAAQAIVRGEPVDPDLAIAALDAVTVEQVREVAAAVPAGLALACVGPHAIADFD